MKARDVAAQVKLRHRAADHLRFAVPAVLCADPAARVIRTAVRGVDGVWGVELHRDARKLSIRFHEAQCSVRQIALALRAAISRAEDLGLLVARAGDDAPATPARWVEKRAATVAVRARSLRARARLLGRALRLKVGSDPILSRAIDERAVTGFLNDLVTFYLIKVHWDLITRRWLPSPLRHGSEWLAVGYLTFLLVRSRRAPPRKP